MHITTERKAYWLFISSAVASTEVKVSYVLVFVGIVKLYLSVGNVVDIVW